MNSQHPLLYLKDSLEQIRDTIKEYNKKDINAGDAILLQYLESDAKDYLVAIKDIIKINS